MCEVKKVFCVEGASLTPEALNTIKDLQDDDNGVLEAHIDVIKDAICYISLTVFDSHNIETCKSLLHDLSYLKDVMKTLKKP